MGQNDSSGIMMQGPFYNLAGVYRRLVNGAPKQLLKGQYPVAIIQKQAAKDLMLVITHSGLEVLHGVLGGRQRLSPLQRFGQLALRHFQHGLKLSVLGRAQAVGLTKTGLFGLQQGAQTTKFLQ